MRSFFRPLHRFVPLDEGYVEVVGRTPFGLAADVPADVLDGPGTDFNRRHVFALRSFLLASASQASVVHRKLKRTKKLNLQWNAEIRTSDNRTMPKSGHTVVPIPDVRFSDVLLA